MNCEQAEMLLYLRRPGESSESERDELAHHLEQCDRCRLLAAKIAATVPVAHAIRSNVPRPADAEQLTRSIMSKIPRGRPAARRQSAMDRLLDVACAPVVRYACAAVVVLALGSFTWQSIDLAFALQGLENRMRGPVGRANLFEVAWSVSTEALKPLIADRQTFEELSRFVPGAETGTVTITSEQLNTMLTNAAPARVPGLGTTPASALSEEEIRRVVEIARQRGEVRIQIRKEGA